MSDKKSSGGANPVTEFENVMQKYKAVTLASVNLVETMNDLLAEPSVKIAHVKEYCKLLGKLKDAEEKMLKNFTSDMIEELVHVGVAAMREGLKDDMDAHMGPCSCGRQDHLKHHKGGGHRK